MVQPIIDLARKNIEHNAKKNEKFTDFNFKLEHHKDDLIKLQKEFSVIKQIPMIVQNCEKSVSMCRTETKGRLDAQDMAIKKLMARQDEVEMLREDIQQMLGERDCEIQALNQRFDTL